MIATQTAGAAPRTAADIAFDTRQARCPLCNPGPGEPCRGINGMHLARYLRAVRKELISDADFDVIAALVPDLSLDRIVPVLIPFRGLVPALAGSSA